MDMTIKDNLDNPTETERHDNNQTENIRVIDFSKNVYTNLHTLLHSQSFCYNSLTTRPYRLMVRTSPSHGENPGSNPGRVM